MDNDVAIKVEHVSKKYCKSLKRSMAYGIGDIGKNVFGIKAKSGQLRNDEFWAVDDVSFEIKKGETIGLIGPNGSGKSTMLKMLNGIFWPDKGKISINGKVGALIEVGAGFHPMLTGRENIYVNAAILGMSKEEIDKRFDDIVRFADIGSFIDTPVKHYSSGMYVRLGFAVAIFCEPDILLIDEVLAVGDMSFQAKCFDKIGELVKKGTTVIMVSHSMTFIQMICQRCIFLNKSKIISQGKTSEVIADYYSEIKTYGSIKESKKLENKYNISLRKISFVDNSGNERDSFDTGEKIIARWSFNIEGRIPNPKLHFSLGGDTYHGYATAFDYKDIEYIDSNSIITLEIPYFGLAAGIYDISVGIWDENFIGSYFWDYNAAKLKIKGSRPMMGRFIFDHTWDVDNKPVTDIVKSSDGGE